MIVSSEPSLAVVIANWNALAFLRDCLASLDRQTAESFEVIVVDNGSSDESRDYLRGLDVRLITLDRNVGFAPAMNLGASSTSASWIFALNADTVLDPSCLELLSAALEEDPSLGGVQPRILQLGAEPAQIYSAGQALTADGRGFELGMGELERAEHLAPAEVFGVCGAACLLRRELFDELGGYDERYFAFCEDVDLNVRARIAGWRFRYVPDALVWHVGNAVWQHNLKRPNEENARLVARNRLATQIKFMPATAMPRIVIVEMGSLTRAVRQRRLPATLAGKLAAFRWLPQLLRERRGLSRAGRRVDVIRWLGHRAGARPAPARMARVKRVAFRVLDALSGGRGRQLGRTIAYAPLDLIDALLGRRNPRLPPRRLRFVGGGDFEAVGEEFLRHFVELCGLPRNARVLDVGCGVGRVAIPLTRYLDDSGSYEGFDIVSSGIDWCRRSISPAHPNFAFHHADIYNRTYNPRGKIAASAFRFPFADAEFDFAFLTSVFTHMLPADVARYAAETTRVLKPGATCLMTWFLLNEETLSALDGDACWFDFKYSHGRYRTVDEATPEAAIAYDEDFALELLKSAGLEVVEPIHFGDWRGTQGGRSAQDIVVVRRQ